MDLQLQGKKALVSGSTAGIGFAIAQSLTQEGAEVYVNGRTQQRVDAAVKAILDAHLPGTITGIAADLGTEEGALALFEKLPAVDILVNNLGIYEPKPFQKISDDDWLRFFKVNVLSGVRLSRHYLPGMRDKNWGRIIFISSESAVQIPVEMIHYGMTKTAQVAVARGLAQTVAGTGVTVNSVLPGPTYSEGLGSMIDSWAKREGRSTQQVEEEFFKSVRPSSLLKRFATNEEVANMVTYVASPRSSATNGAALRVEGGVVQSLL